MTRIRKTRTLLLAFTALSVLALPVHAQNTSGNGGVLTIPGLDLPKINRNATQRSGITTSVGQALEDPVAASPSEISTIGDNLGNHTAIQDISLNGNDLIMRGGDILSEGGRVLGIPLTPGQETEASSKYYVDQLGLDLTSAITVIEGDVQTLFERRINTPANQGLTGGGPLSSDLTLTVDGTVVRTGGNQTVNGAKTFTGPVSLSGTRLLGVATPQGDTDGVNKAYVDTIGNTLGEQIDLVEDTFLSRRIDTGTGLSGGGDLTQDRILSFDTSWGDARYALRSRSLTAGDGLTGGGSLAADRAFAVDATVVRTTGNQNIAGNKTFTGLLSFSNGRLTSVGTPVVGSDAATKGYVDGVRDELETDLMALSARRIDTGTGLLGGGDLSANRTLAFDTGWGDARYAEHLTSGFSNALTYDELLGLTGNGAATFAHSGAGRPSDAPFNAQMSGLHIGNTWGRAQVLFPNTANRILFRNGTATTWSEVWHSGNLNVTNLAPVTRSINAGTGLTGGGNLSADRTITFDTAWGDARYAMRARSLTAGTGLTGGGTLAADRTIELAANQIRRDATSTATGVLAYNGRAAANAQFYGGSTNPTSTNAAHRVNFQGSLYATRFYGTQYFYFSDATLKENVERIEGPEGLDLLRQIRPVRYDWKETGREALGVIAQETAQVLPNLVDTDENGIMSVDYIQLIAPLIASVQELDARVNALEAQGRDRSEP